MSSSSFEITTTEIYGERLLERGVYRIFLGLYWAFIKDGRLKESGRLLEKIRYALSVGFKMKPLRKCFPLLRQKPTQILT